MDSTSQALPPEPQAIPLPMDTLVVPLDQVDLSAIAMVGGKNASLGEMIRALADAGVRVPGGFATTAEAYRLLLRHNQLSRKLELLLAGLDSEDLGALQHAGATARGWLEAAELPGELETAIRHAYRSMGAPAVAVRSSATAEDLPEASFAGQQESFLHIEGEEPLLRACKRCFASLFTDRAISYRQLHGYQHQQVALSIGVQRMVQADQACAGVMFSIDTESGFRDAVLLTAAYGLGERVVQGAVNPDEWLVFKPTLKQGFRPILSHRLGDKATRLVRCDPPVQGRPVRIEPVPEADRQRFSLSDEDVLTLARGACRIEEHYTQRRGKAPPMDIEWAKDGLDGQLYVLQARPETVQSRSDGAVLRRWQLDTHQAVPLVCGQAIGSAVSSGVVRVLRHPDAIGLFSAGDVLVSERTDPDWEPILRRACGVITDQGGRTCHAAIIAREMGITAIVGTGDGSRRLRDGDTVTVSCCEGEQGRVYAGVLPFHLEEQALAALPSTRTRILMNVGNPEDAFRLSAIPCDGVGLARLEFIIANQIRVHPLALLQPAQLSRQEREAIAALIQGYDDPADYYIDKLAQGMGRIAAAFHPQPVLLRFSDFKSNEYARLLGGSRFEPKEENPMLGWRGAARYTSAAFAPAFALECRALQRVREMMGLTNAMAMVPFCRTPEEGDEVLAAMAANGLPRGRSGLKIYVMIELPSNVISAEAFAARFDGFSIGSNDLTQLTLGLDRDSALLADRFDERQDSVQAMIRMAIRSAHRCGLPIGICGQAPSDHPDFARFLVEEGIDSISLNPDAVLPTRMAVAALEQELGISLPILPKADLRGAAGAPSSAGMAMAGDGLPQARA